MTDPTPGQIRKIRRQALREAVKWMRTRDPNYRDGPEVASSFRFVADMLETWAKEHADPQTEATR